MFLNTMFVLARLAQSVEHETLNLRVVGSTPTLGVHSDFEKTNSQITEYPDIPKKYLEMLLKKYFFDRNKVTFPSCKKNVMQQTSANVAALLAQ